MIQFGPFEFALDPTLKQIIEQTARQCVSHPAFEEVLHNAAATDKHGLLLKGKEFVVDPSAEGHDYYCWCVENIRRQNQLMMSPEPSHQMIQQQTLLNTIPAFGHPSAPVIQQQDQFKLSYPPAPAAPVSRFSAIPHNYDILALIEKYKEPETPSNSDVPIITATVASKNWSQPLVFSLFFSRHSDFSPHSTSLLFVDIDKFRFLD